MCDNGAFVYTDEVIDVSNEGERYVPQVFSYCAAMHLGHMAAYKQALRYAFGKKILDLGCGTGYGSNFLASFGAESVYAADFSSIALNYAKKHYFHPNIKHIQLDGNKPLPFGDETFDFVFCSQVIEHIKNPEALLAEIRRVLKNNSFCLITAPNKNIFSPDPDHGSNEHHVSEMNLKEYEAVGKAVFPRAIVAGIPQNCIVALPDNEVSVKSNEEIKPEDYRLTFDNAGQCENLLLLGHNLPDGEFKETLPESLRHISDDLAPLYLDNRSRGWVKLGAYPGSYEAQNLNYKVPPLGSCCRGKLAVPYNYLYRIDIGMAAADKYDVKIAIRQGSDSGEIFMQLTAKTKNNRLTLIFPPVPDSQGKTYYLELRTACSTMHRLFKRDALPRFEYHGKQLVSWSFHHPVTQLPIEEP